MPDSHVLEETRKLIQQRIEELDEERKRLERALAELGGKVRRVGRRPGRPAGGKRRGRKGSGGKRRGRKGKRAEQAVKFVADNPGTTAADVAKAMKIKPNYLYRVLGDLEKEGRVEKKGRQYFPVE